MKGIRFLVLAAALAALACPAVLAVETAEEEITAQGNRDLRAFGGQVRNNAASVRRDNMDVPRLVLAAEPEAEAEAVLGDNHRQLRAFAGNVRGNAGAMRGN